MRRNWLKVCFYSSDGKVWKRLVNIGTGNDGQMVRVILVPRFDATGEIVVLDLETLEPELVSFRVET